MIRWMLLLMLSLSGCAQKGIVASGAWEWVPSDHNLVGHKADFGYELGVVGLHRSKNSNSDFSLAGISYDRRSLRLESGNEAGALKITSIDAYFAIGFDYREQFYFAPGFRVSFPIEATSEFAGKPYQKDGAYHVKYYGEMDFGYRFNPSLNLSTFIQLNTGDYNLIFNSRFYDHVSTLWSIGLRATYIFADEKK